MNTKTQTSPSAVTQGELDAIGKCLKSSLEYYAHQLFTSSQHYLIDIHTGSEAVQAWAGETIDQGMAGVDEPIRLVYRMLSGVTQKQQKKLFPWTTFCFKPATVALDGGVEPSSFLNLHAMRSISRRLWAMVCIYDNPTSKRPPELCCYVDRHIPALDAALEPQIRIPLRSGMKLAVDERSGVATPAAIFSDNNNLGKPLQALPQSVDLFEDEGLIQLKLTNASAEPVTLCELVVCDYDEDEVEFDELFTLSGIEEGQVIAAGASVEVSINRQGDDLSALDSLIIGYALGTADELDEDDDELMTEIELKIPLQGEDTRTFHVSLMQGETYDMLKRALLSPESFIEDLGEDLAQRVTQLDDEFNLNGDTSDSASLFLNAADLDGGGVGTLTLEVQTARDPEDFGPLLCEDQEAEPELRGQHFTLRGQSSIPEQLIQKKRGRKVASDTLAPVILEPIYLGKLSLYNELTTLDYGQARSFILNCVAIASLVRSLRTKLSRDDEGLDESLLV